MTVADRIKIRRIELGLSQDELAKRMGYSTKSAVSRTENAGDNIGQKRINAFAKALNCSPSELMGWTSVNNSDFFIEAFSDDYRKNAIKLYNKYIAADKKTRKMIDMLLEEGESLWQQQKNYHQAASECAYTRIRTI